MSRSRKFAPSLAVACALFAALGLTLVSSYAAPREVTQLGAHPVGVHPTFDKKEFHATNVGTQRTIGIANNINKKKNISKGISPDG